MLDRIPLLFCGKTILEDMRTLANLVEEGIVMPQNTCHRSLPTSAVTAWMCFSNFLNHLNLQQIEQGYANIL